MPSWKKIIVSGSNVSQLTNDLGFARTGSANTFYANQTINGNLIVTGSITALQYIVSSSVIYITESNFSGSHVFGNTMDDTHQFTGSVYITGSLSSDYVAFNTSDHPISTTGQLGWNTGNSTLELGLSGSAGVIPTLLVGEQNIARVYNAQGSTITKGQVAYISGSQGNRIAVKLASATAELGSANTLGFVYDDIAAGSDGYIITEGPLQKLNTIGLTAGLPIYLSTTAGAYTQTAPTAPNHRVILGFVERVNATVGSIYVKVDNGYELNELHNVLISNTPYGGDLLVLSGSVWINTNQLTGSYNITGSLTVTDNITSTLYGTASWANNALTASYAPTYVLNSATSSFVTNSQTASFVQNNQTSSFVTNSQTSSMLEPYTLNSQTSSFVTNSQTSSMTVLSSSFASTASLAPNYVLNSATSSFILNSQTASFITNSQTSSMLAPYVLNSATSSFVTNAQTSSFVLNSQTSSFIINSQTSSMLAPYVLNTSTSSFVTNNQTSSFVLNSQTASFITNSQTSSMLAPYVLNSSTSSFVTNSQTSSMTVATASFVTSSKVFGPYGANSILSASYALTASYALNGSGGTPGGSNYGIQYNSASVFQSSTNFQYIYPSNSFQHGNLTNANGQYTHAEGYNTIASSYYSHAEGYSSQANGYSSHAEGASTQANAYSTHTEGVGTIANSAYSHAEGRSTTTNGEQSHAEGYGSTTSGEGAHAEGRFTLASGSYSHAEGTNIIVYAAPIIDITTITNVTFDFGSYPVVSCDGTSIIISGDITGNIPGGVPPEYTLTSLDVTDGVNTITVEFSYYGAPVISSATYNVGTNETTLTFTGLQPTYQTVATGIGPIAAGYGSHAEGFGTLAYGEASHAEGYNTIASGAFSHAEGNNSIASGSYSHAEGVSNQAIGEGSHAEGNSTKAWGVGSHTEGSSTNAYGDFSKAIGNSTTAYGNHSFAAGTATIASGSSQTVVGIWNKHNNITDLFVVGGGYIDATPALVRQDVFAVSTTTITMSGSVNISGSLSLNGAPILPKGGSVNQASFGGTPLSASVTFTLPMPSTNYSIAITGQDPRIWSYSNKATTGFIINSNSSTALTAAVDWTATLYS